MNLMELAIKVLVKDEEARTKIKKFTDGATKSFKAIAKVSGIALGAAATGVAALTKQAVSSYAEYEQLVGGIETLFKDSAGLLQDYAAKAYETAGLSANEYMNTAIGFSGALLKSLNGDTAAAAEMTQTAITDMADQANKYGKTVAEISATYTSLARGNYQTLDNLFGGMFAGTKSGLEEMLKYAEDYRASLGETVDYSADSYADILSAIHDVSVATGVYGTTAEEAAKTISGSLGMLKASWANLLTGLGTEGANIEQLFDNMVQAAETFLGNVTPVVERVLDNIGKLLIKKAPELGKKLPKILQKLLPGLIEGATGLISSLAKALPDILLVVLQQLPALVDSALTIGKAVIDGFVEGIPKLFGAIWTALDDAMSGVDENGNQQSSYWIDLWNRMKASASDALETIKTKVDELKEPFARMSESFNTFKTHIDDIVQKIQKWEEEHHVLEHAFELVSAKIQVGLYIIEGLFELVNLKIQAVDLALTGIEKVFDAVKKAGADAADWIKSHWEELSGVIGSVANALSPMSAIGGWIGGGGKPHAIGNDYVPYDNYPALLHRGEAVLTAREADAWRRGAGNGQQIVNNFTFNGVSQSDLDYIVGYVNRELVSG